MENWLRQKLEDAVSSSAMWAMMTEAAITPKPGLVDRANSGSHRDMDFFTFIDSASALLPWFRSCGRAGFDSGTNSGGINPKDLFESLRPPGRIAESVMKKAAGGANPHKGYIFSMGLLASVYGRLYRFSEKPGLADIQECTRAMTVSLTDDFFCPGGGALSHGEAVYAASGIQGIRGEASQAFPSVTEQSLPLLRRLLNEGYSLNNAGIAVLLKILSKAEDTNVIHRGGEKTLKNIQDDIRMFFAADSAGRQTLGAEAVLEKAEALDKDFIARGISPGGSADLLGITLFLYRLLESPV